LASPSSQLFIDAIIASYYLLGFGAFFFASFLLGKQKNRSEAKLGEAK
jgi:hypothetical protein